MSCQGEHNGLELVIIMEILCAAYWFLVVVPLSGGKQSAPVLRLLKQNIAWPQKLLGPALARVTRPQIE